MKPYHRSRTAIRQIGILCALMLFALGAFGQSQGEHDFGDYTVYHTVFNSMFLQPDIAAAYQLERGEEVFYLNVSVNRKDQFHGQKATLAGTAKNLIQQQKVLRFAEVDEGEAVYYLAPLKVKGEEVMHFALEVQPVPEVNIPITFTHKLISE